MLTRTVAVAAIQPDCSSSSVEANLNALAAQAADQGAGIVLLPERFSEPFRLDHTAWWSASAQCGRVEEWLQSAARRHGIYLGGSYLEARGQDFYNTFALASPTGKTMIRWRRQKILNPKPWFLLSRSRSLWMTMKSLNWKGWSTRPRMRTAMHLVANMTPAKGMLTGTRSEG